MALTYKASYLKPSWELYKDIDLNDGGPHAWTIVADEEQPEAGVCLAFDAGKRDICVVLTLTELLLMAQAVVKERGNELFYGVDTSKISYGKKDAD